MIWSRSKEGFTINLDGCEMKHKLRILKSSAVSALVMEKYGQRFCLILQ